MTKRTWKLVAMVAVLCICSMGSGALAQTACDEERCADMKARCATAPDWEIDHAAYLGSSGQSSFGSCYFHDRLTCPDCACHIYVKVSYKSGDKGYDGGTGCINGATYGEAHQKAIQLLRQLCLDGVCCRPQVATNPCGDPAPVYARDSATGSCYQFPNACSVPSGWSVMPFGC